MIVLRVGLLNRTEGSSRLDYDYHFLVEETLCIIAPQALVLPAYIRWSNLQSAIGTAVY